MRPVVFTIAIACLLTATTDAMATYSVVATDSAQRLVGGAGASCVGSLSVTIIIGTVEDVGALHAQSQVDIDLRDEGVRLLRQGESPRSVVASITAPEFDDRAAVRQYGVVDLMGRAAGWTGQSNWLHASDRQGTDGVYTYSVQGNVLTGPAVIEQTERGFIDGGGCDLPEKLMLALEAGADNGQGDSRCTALGLPADSAFIRVVAADRMPVIDLDVTDTAPDDPLVSLRARFDDWRALHPCPEDPGGDAAAGDAGSCGPDGSCGVDGPVTSGSCRSSAGDRVDLLLPLLVCLGMWRRRLRVSPG